MNFYYDVFLSSTCKRQQCGNEKRGEEVSGGGGGGNERHEQRQERLSRKLCILSSAPPLCLLPASTHRREKDAFSFPPSLSRSAQFPFVLLCFLPTEKGANKLPKAEIENKEI